MCLELYITKKEGEETIHADEIRKRALQVADEDIVCYKILKVRLDEGRIQFLTPYQESKVMLGRKYCGKNPTPFEVENCSEDWFISVGGGYIHSYIDRGEAVLNVYNCGEGDIVVKCIIPKGATYFEGRFYEDTAYASNKIIYTKEIVYISEDIDDEIFGVLSFGGKCEKTLKAKYNCSNLVEI